MDIKQRNKLIRLQAKHLAELEADHHRLNEKQKRAVKYMYIKLLRSKRLRG